MDDDAISALVARLSRRHKSGGRVIEHATILAEGVDSSVVLDWVIAHGGVAEELPPVNAGGGLHSSRMHDETADRRPPLRYVLPADALR